MNDRIVTKHRRFNKETMQSETYYIPRGPSELSDAYLVTALRDMEQRMPRTEDLVVGFVESAEEIEDGKNFRNYEVFKIEAETRGIVWRTA